MNPFAWPGPAFLVFYVSLGLVVCSGLWWMRRRREAPVATPRLDDPYLVATLRGGEDDAIRLAMLVLMGRDLVVADESKQLARAPNVTAAHVGRSLEKAVLESLDRPRAVDDLLGGVRGGVARAYETTLARMRLLPDDGQRSARRRLWGLGFGTLMVVAAIKVAIGISRDAPVAGLIVAALVFGVASASACFPRRTESGDELVKHFKALFASLKQRVASLSRRIGDPLRDDVVNDVTWLGAVFGLQALPVTMLPAVEIVLPKRKQESSSDSGSSCGSSCGSSSGSSCGGGGCGGGCGGCG